MRLAYAFMAHAAEFTPDGKIYVLGGDFETLRVPVLPAIQPAMTLVVKLEVQPTECQREHRLRVELIDEDGAKLHPEIVLPFTPQVRAEHPHRAVGVGLVIGYQGLQLPKSGGYAFHVLVDDLEAGIVPLFVEQIKPAAQGSEH